MKKSIYSFILLLSLSIPALLGIDGSVFSARNHAPLDDTPKNDFAASIKEDDGSSVDLDQYFFLENEDFNNPDLVKRSELETLLAKINAAADLNECIALLKARLNLYSERLFPNGKFTAEGFKKLSILSGYPIIVLDVLSGNPYKIGIFPDYFSAILVGLPNGSTNLCTTGQFSLYDDKVQKELKAKNLGLGGLWTNPTITIPNWRQLWQENRLLFFIIYDEQLHLLYSTDEQNRAISGIASDKWHSSLLKKGIIGYGAAVGAAVAAGATLAGNTSYGIPFALAAGAAYVGSHMQSHNHFGPSIGQQTYDAVAPGVSGAYNTATPYLSGAYNAVSSGVSKAYDTVSSRVGMVGSAVASGASSIKKKVSDGIHNMFSSATMDSEIALKSDAPNVTEPPPPTMTLAEKERKIQEAISLAVAEKVFSNYWACQDVISAIRDSLNDILTFPTDHIIDFSIELSKSLNQARDVPEKNPRIYLSTTINDKLKKSSYVFRAATRNPVTGVFNERAHEVYKKFPEYLQDPSSTNRQDLWMAIYNATQEIGTYWESPKGQQFRNVLFFLYKTRGSRNLPITLEIDEPLLNDPSIPNPDVSNNDVLDGVQAIANFAAICAIQIFLANEVPLQ